MNALHMLRAALAATEQDATPALTRAFKDAATACRSKKTLTVSGQRVVVFADAVGLAAHPELWELKITAPSGRYIVRLYNHEDHGNASVTVGKLDTHGGWDLDTPAFRITHAVSASDLLKQIVTHVLHPGARA